MKNKKNKCKKRGTGTSYQKKLEQLVGFMIGNGAVLFFLYCIFGTVLDMFFGIKLY